MARKLAALALLFSLAGCGSLTNFSTVEPPPGGYGRPAVVRGVARAGSYVGAAVGIVAFVVTRAAHRVILGS